MSKEIRRKWIEIGAGAVFYIILLSTAKYQSHDRTIQTALYLVPYVIVSFETYFEMLKGIRHFRFFNENLLMILATIGAFCVGRNVEATGAMLFFEIGILIEKIAFGKTKKSIAKFMDIRPE